MPRSPLLSLPGAVPADGQDAGVAAHFGDPLGEQRVLENSVGLVDRSNRGVVTVSGPDRLSWLHSLTTQHLSELPAWRGTEALVLSPHGHIEHHLVIADDGAVTWIDVEPGTEQAVVEFLDSMRFLLRVDPQNATDRWACLALLGPQTADLLAAAGVELPPALFDVRPLPDGGIVRRMPYAHGDSVDLLVSRSTLADVAERLLRGGARPVGTLAYEALRVAARRPRLGRETDHRTIVQEGGWLDFAVHLDKGCYRGQETVARVHNLGRPPRRLVLLHLDGTAETLPPQATPVLLDGRPVGFIGTAVWHHELGPIALALVKRTVGDGAALRVDQANASIDAA